MRRLEIGPGWERLDGFETLNAVKTPFTDHVGDARKLPFADATFAEVYSSHCIEHVEWFEIEETIAEWARVLQTGGWLEVHTVNAEPLMRALLGECEVRAGKWRQDLHKGNPYLWASGRIMNYQRKGEGGAHWMHRAILTPKFMLRSFIRAGLAEIEPVAEPRGSKKHRAVNMGLRGRKC